MRHVIAGILGLALPALGLADLTNIASVNYGDAAGQTYNAASNMAIVFVMGNASSTPAIEPNKIKVYPNPWRNDRNATQNITFANLSLNSQVKLFTLSGRLVKTLSSQVSQLGTLCWDLTNDRGENVVSGLYVYLVTDGQGNKVRGKVAIIK